VQGAPESSRVYSMQLLLTILCWTHPAHLPIAAVGFILAQAVPRRCPRAFPCDLQTPGAVPGVPTDRDQSSERRRTGKIVAFTLLLVAVLGLVARLVAVPFTAQSPGTVAFLIVVMFSNAGNYGRQWCCSRSAVTCWPAPLCTS